MRARRMITMAWWAALSAVSMGLIAGCTKRHTAYDELYARLVEEPGALDWSVLEGRTIVIDPGHGGNFRGAIGSDGLAEADVNLGVALNLWGLLEEAGADVVLTRSTDRDFLPPGSLDLGDDLEGRMQRANEHEADVFISIHHNANLPVDRAVNRIEVYYPGDDPGASLELAGDLRLHLARNLGIDEAHVTPGNYYVLRSSRARASILGEASYLSHPGVEQRLKLAEKQRLEAEAYFLGLITYFSRGVPSIERLAPPCDTIDAPAALVFTVERSPRVPIDPSSVRVTLGSDEVPAFYDPVTGTIRCALDADVPNGSHEVSAAVRSVRGGTARCAPFTLVVRRPARFILPLPAGAAPGGTISCRVKILDELGCPVSDKTPVKAIALAGGNPFRGEVAGGIFSFDTAADNAGGAFLIETEGLADTIRFAIGGAADALTLAVVDAASGAAVPYPVVTRIGGRTARGDARGLLFLPSTGPPDSVIVSAPGYRPAMLPKGGSVNAAPEAGAGLVRLTAIFGGVLREVRIAIDPGGGGSDDEGTGPGKCRGASINRDVAERLGEMLEGAGARVTLTRRGEETIGEEERVFRINSSGAEYAIGIHRAGSGEDVDCRVLHYPGSERGTALACSLAAALGDLPPCREYTVLPAAGPLLRQTSCPACEIFSGSITDASVEKILSHPRYAHLAAERILCAVLRHLGGPDRRWYSRTVRVLDGGAPVGGAALCIDQTVSAVTDDGGCARFTCIDAGIHAATIESPDARRRALRFFDIEAEGPEIITLELSAGREGNQ